MSSDIIDMKARSREGRGLSQKAGEHWIEIQKNTFMNWVNLQLHGSGLTVSDFENDFDDGVRLCALVEALQSRKIGRVIKKPLNQHQSLENVTLALRAIAEDGVRLVNIGSEDIVNGSLKLILGLAWHLILRYQIGKTKFPPKKLMLAWLQAVIPECHITNFTSDWNDGVALHALIEYCTPGLCPDWRQLSRSDRLANCTDAIQLANDKLGIPIVVRPEDFCSPHLDDLSGMTYLSYFMNVDSPGYFATRREIRALLQGQAQIENFTTDWNDGWLLCTLVKCVGGDVAGWPGMDTNHEKNLQNGVDGARQLGIEPIFSAKEMADPEVEHLGIMAYAAYFRKYKPVKIAQSKPTLSGNFDDIYVRQEKRFVVNSGGCPPSSIRAEVVGPTSTVPVDCQWNDDRCDCSFAPSETGQHKLNVYHDDENIPGCPVPFRVNSDRSKILYQPLDRAVVGMNSEMKVDTLSAGQGEIRIEATSPSGRVQTLPVMYQNEGVHAGNFVPNEVGDWTINILYDGEDVQGSPYTVKVFDPSLVRITDLHGGKVGHGLSFGADASSAGEGEVRCEVYHEGENVPCYLTRNADDKYQVDFTPQGAGTYKIHAYMNDIEVKGSPFYSDIEADTSNIDLVAVDTSLVNTAPADFSHIDTATADLTDTDAAEVDFSHIDTALAEASRIDTVAAESSHVDIDTATTVVVGSKVVEASETVVTGGSPYDVNIIDSTRVTVTGEGLSLIPVNTPAVFHIQAHGAGGGKVDVDITAPSGRHVPCHVVRSEADEQEYLVHYLLEETGEYTIEVKFAEQEVTGSPFMAKAFDTRKLVVSDMPTTASREEPVVFHIDASQAGSGNIEIRVNEGRVQCSVENRGDYQFTASFLPENSQPHNVEMTFNDTPVEGSPWNIYIVDRGAINIKGEERVPCHKKATVRIQPKGQRLAENDLDASIQGPTNQNVPYNLSSDSSGDTIITYIPTEVGDYTVRVKYGEHDVSGSPFTAKAYNTGAIIVTPIEDGFVNQPMHFTIDVGEAGEGQLQIMVNNGNIPNEVESQEPGKYRIKFIPTEPGMQQVDIHFNDHSLPCSPLTCVAQDLSATIVGLTSLIPVQNESNFRIQSQAHITNVATDVVITGPSGHSVPVRVSPQADGRSLRVDYTPREIGIHSIRAALQGQAVKGSPFQVRTFDPSLVRMSKVKQGIVGVPCKFTVDTVDAGEGTVDVSVQSHGRKVPTTVLSAGGGRYDCSFIGQSEGNYQVTITYNDMHAQGSPFSVNVIDVGGIRITGDHWNLISLDQRAGFSIVSPHGSFDDLSVKIVAPNGANVPFRLSERADGTAKIDWQPTVVGSHKVFIDYAGVPIQGSPFTIKVFDASQVRVSNIHPGLVNRPCSFTLDASTAGDGNLEILVMHGEEIVPNYVQDEGNTVFKVTFTPRHAGLHLVHTQFNGVAVPGSPHQVPVLDPESVQVSGSGVDMAAANVPTSFRVDMRNAGDAKLNVRVVSPYGKEIPVQVHGNPKSGLKIDYTPYEVGVYKVFVECAGVPAKGSPFSCNVYDPSLIRINAPGRAYLGRPIHFNLDTSAAGRGKLDFQVTCRGHDVPTRLREVGPERYDVSFTPQYSAPHRVHVNFNDMQVPGTPFDVAVIDSSNVNVSGDGVKLAKVFKEAALTLEHDGLEEQDIEVKVISPSGSTLPARLTNHNSNTSQISFTPLEVGLHRVHVTVGDSPVPGSPFTCSVYDPSACRITDVDKTAKREREIGFTIDSSAAGAGTLEVEVTHRGQAVRTECYKLAEGRHSYTFRPKEVGRYEVRATFNGETIPGTPLIIDVEEDTPTFIRIHFSSSEPIKASGRNSFLLQMNGHRVDRSMLNVHIKAPNGENLPARLIQQADGDYKVEWTPQTPGRHLIEVLFGGQQVSGSPFYIDVFDIHKIRVNNFYNGKVNETAGFKVDCTQAGKGNQEIRIESPSGRNVPFEVVENWPLEYHVTYTPTESGQHKIFISYSNMELNGSPFHQEISEGFLPPATGEGLHKGEEDKPATFLIDARGLKGEPQVQVDGPNAIAKCSIDPLPDGQYKVTYIPVEVGLFSINVKWNGKEIPGSPFHPKVVDSRKVKVVGGWQHYMDGNERIHLIVGEEKRIPFDTSEAGPGQLRAEVKSPSSFLPVQVDDEHKGRSTVVFTPREEGTHYLNLYWSDHPLVNSPYIGYATSGVADPSKVWLTGRGLKEAIVREEAEFVIDGSQAGPGEPDVALTGVRAEIQVITTPLGGGKFRCTYIPVIPGAYLLNISWNGRQLRGAPYKVNVIGASYPDRVVVSGEGLRGGLLGQSLDFRIDTKKAGPGELTAYCMGPTQVAYCELSDHHDGTYRLVVRPQETGRHVLQIKYGGVHVQGSPFAFRVSAQPDASKVRVSGPGVEHGILANFHSEFIVETRGAGAGQLTVRIRGPKGAFQVEMYRESQKDRKILCRYYPTSTGQYIINVRWSEVDVPGSPFHVYILDTHHELENLLHEQSFGAGHTALQHNSFHNTSLSSSHHNNSFHQQAVQPRFTAVQQNGSAPMGQQTHHHTHNVSRSSGYYQWREDM